MDKKQRLLVFGLILVTLLLFLIKSQTGQLGKANTSGLVKLTKEGFSPKEIVVNAGDVVRWKNLSGGTQTVNSDDHPANRLYLELNFGVFSNGQTFVHTFTKPGVYTYHNHYNPEQRGTITVR